MLRYLAKTYIAHRRKFIISTLVIGVMLIISAIIIKTDDDKHPSRRDKIYCEKQISKLTHSFDTFSDKWFKSEIPEYSEQFNKRINIFNNYECVVILYKQNKIVYISSNAVEPDSVNLNIINNNDNYVFTGSRQTIPIIKRHGTDCALLLITLASQNSHINKTNKIVLNKKLIPSQNIYITSFSELGERIYSPNSKHLFSFTYNSRSDNWILVDILLTLGLVLIIITTLPFASGHCHRKVFQRVLISLSFTFTLLLIINIFGIAHKLLWIIPIVIYTYTNVIFHILRKLRCKKTRIQCNMPQTFKIVYNVLIPVYAIFLSAIIVNSISRCNEYIYIYILPIIILTAGFLNILWGFSIVNKHNKTTYPTLFFAIISIVVLTVFYFINTKLFLVTLIVTVPTTIVLSVYKRFSRITIFYVITISISVACTYMLTNIDNISMFGESYSFTKTTQPLNFYMSLLNEKELVPLESSGSNSFHSYLTIILYSTITIVASSILLLERKIYRVRKNSMSRKVHITLYLTITIILFLSIILSRNFVKSIKQESVNMYVERICNSIIVDYLGNGADIESWVDKRETNYNINVDIYSKDGILLYHSVKDTNALTIVPKRINSDLVNTINQHPNKNHIIIDSYLSRLNYLSVYTAIPGNLILHIPFDERYTMQNYYPMITRFINIFICSLLILLFITTIVYNRLTRPLEVLNRNMKIMRARKRISVTEFSNVSNSEVASIINEYNKMINELENQYHLQITVERQNTWNKLIRLIAHEVKNPLTPILLKSQMILYRKSKGDDSWQSLIDDTLNTIIEQTKRISGLISTMMDSPEKYIGGGEEVEVIPLLESVKNFYSAYSRINFNIINHTPDVDAILFFNRDNLWSVISNITSNAIDAIISKNTINGTISFFVTTTPGKMIIKIYNNGETIPKDHIPKIFNFSFTTKTDGNGLGLYLVQQIINIEDGEISVTSSDDIGTEFTITIPRHKKEIKGTTGKVSHPE